VKRKKEGERESRRAEKGRGRGERGERRGVWGEEVRERRREGGREKETNKGRSETDAPQSREEKRGNRHKPVAQTPDINGGACNVQQVITKNIGGGRRGAIRDAV
jgi:hypothetical protein